MATRAKYEGGVLSYFDNASHERTARFAPVQFYDDFIGSAVVIPAAASPEGGMPWVVKAVGEGTAAVGADSTNGVVSCALTATSEKQNGEVYMNDELQFSIVQGLVFEARFALSVLPTLAAEFVVGLISAWADGLDAATYSVFATCDGGGLITCEKDDNATDESASSGVTLIADEYAIVRIDCTTAADIKFYVNGNRVASGTTFDWAASAANSKVQPVFGCYKASGAGLGTALVDYVRVYQNRT